MGGRTNLCHLELKGLGVVVVGGREREFAVPGQVERLGALHALYAFREGVCVELLLFGG